MLKRFLKRGACCSAHSSRFLSQVVSLHDISGALGRLQSRVGSEVRFCITSKQTFQIDVFINSSWETLLQAPDTNNLLTLIDNAASLFQPSDGLKVMKSIDNVKSPMTNVIFDWATDHKDPRLEASAKIQAKFPRLALHTTHTTAADLQGNKTHTISVALRPLQSDIIATAEESEAINRFRGESVGLGFRGTLRRALSSAFTELGDSFSPSAPQDDEPMTMSVVRLYTQVLDNDLKISWDESNCLFTVQKAGKTISQITHKSPIVALLSALEAASSAYSPSAYEDVKNKLSNSGLYVLLPDKSVNAKHLLEKILQFFIGINSSALTVDVLSNNGIFNATVKVIIPFHSMKIAETDLDIVLSRASGRSKKNAKELAVVKAIEDHFPQIYNDQIAFHPEIQRMRSNENASEDGDICPHISRGLLCQLEWATKKAGFTFSIDSTRVVPKTSKENDEDSSTAIYWKTIIFLFNDHEKKTPIFSYVVSDARKSRSTQKAIAGIIYQKFRKNCLEAVEYAINKRLLNPDGSPVLDERLEELAVENDDVQYRSDPLIRELQLAPYQYIKGNDPSDVLPLMERYRLFADDFARLKYKSPYARMHEKIHEGETESSATLTAILEGKDGGIVEQLDYVKVTHKLPLRALLSAYVKLLELHAIEGGVSTTKELQVAAAVFSKQIPSSFPNDLPLSSIAQLVMNLYGCAILMNFLTEGNSTVVRLYAVDREVVDDEGVSPAEGPLNDSLFLGRGEGSDVHHAVFLCCRQIYNNHFKVLGSLFSELETSSLKSMININPKSTFYDLLQSVVEEIKVSLPSSTTCTESVVVEYGENSTPPIQLCFKIEADNKKVELEKVKGSDFIELLQDLGNCISLETQFIFCAPKRISEPNLSHFQRVTILLSQFLGISVENDVLRRDGVWYCRLTALVGHNYYWCLCTASASKKNDATEAAALYAIRKYFPKIFTDLSPSNSILSVCDSNTTFGGFFFSKDAV